MRLFRNLCILISLILIVTACSQQQGTEDRQTIIPADEQKVQNTGESSSTDSSDNESDDAAEMQDAKNQTKPIELGEPDLNIKVGDVEQSLNVDKMTYAEIQSYWSNLKGKTVKWAGKVDNIAIKDKFFRVRVTLHETANGRPFFAVLMGQRQEGDGIDAIKKDDQITFIGKITKFRPGSADKGSAIILRGSKVVSPE